mmetsp:Transcript_9904/g.10003  ORF Transcript_9904/g.10003 Transcript_9904/m.10003 type:complete len:129 (-) Transcript_9904:102-488(-)|eukprot:CAMPEP_0182423598 /NCGR_PEP_ID=MMETSP1167-20130531/9649_1 /TAXON_ID=2988 /ORGANISM="Mallomonas Sp, Strain CCMP3275" /LENGTH=128 /DNA_ID=CAMNT_0024602725 /DNA_START=222 /DNA_END=608 /DNA_ORIENTATION=+
MPVAKPTVRGVQDVPPPGGFPKVNLTRGIGPRGPPGWLIWLSVVTASIYGMWQIGRTNKVKRIDHKEKREARIAILPYLQAESDRQLIAKITESNRQEAEIMKNVDGWKVGESVYSKRWMPPTNGLSK